MSYLPILSFVASAFFLFRFIRPPRVDLEKTLFDLLFSKLKKSRAFFGLFSVVFFALGLIFNMYVSLSWRLGFYEIAAVYAIYCILWGIQVCIFRFKGE